jgi:galactose mutarotase-like enzyme
MSEQHNAWVSLRSPDLTAAINPLGAQLSVLKDRQGRDLLWDGDPTVWNGRAPLLFPIVGTLAGGSYRLGAKSYALSRHGFARGSLFEIMESSSSAATFRLRASQSTLQVYPFRFELDVHFALTGATLSVSSSVRNVDTQTMPASFGYHPALRWPLPYGQPRAAHFIEFESDEPAPARRLNAAGLLTTKPEPTPIVQRRLPLTDALFKDDVLIFDHLRSHSVSYGAGSGPRITLSFPDSPYLGIWTKPAAQFICIEPWHGIADPDGFVGDFTEKPGVFVLPAGAVLTTTMMIALTGD